MALHRLASVTVAVPDVAATSIFYRDFGLTETAPGVFATALGGEQLRLVAGARRRLVGIALATDSPDDIDRIAARLQHLGIAAQHNGAAVESADVAAGIAVRVSVLPRLQPAPEPRTPYNGPGRRDRSGRAPGILTNAPACPRRLGHVVYATPDLAASQRFYLDGLGFQVSDTIAGHAAFMRCSSDHHNLLVQQGPVHVLHHTAWEVGDIDEIGRGARAVIAADPERHVWGFGRHHVGSNFFWYLRDPAGNFAEYYADLDVIPEDAVWTPGDWEGLQALYNWGPPPPPSFFVPDDLAALMAG